MRSKKVLTPLVQKETKNCEEVVVGDVENGVVEKNIEKEVVEKESENCVVENEKNKKNESLIDADSMLRKSKS